MDNSYEQGHQLRALAMRVSALEDNVAFLEEWCEEQQDALDRSVGPVAYDYEVEASRSSPPSRVVLRVVDLRDVEGPTEKDDDAADAGTIVALVETEHDRKVRQIRLQLNRLRTRLAASLVPQSSGPEPPTAQLGRRPEPPRQAQKLSETPAGRTAP
jgi:hypothetical protein